MYRVSLHDSSRQPDWAENSLTGVFGNWKLTASQSKTATIRGIYQKLDKRICASCPTKVFLECKR